MKQAARIRALRRMELLARIASERETVVQGWHACSERVGMLEGLALKLRGLSRSPLFYLATAATTWMIGRQRSLTLLRKALRTLGA